MMMQTMDKYKAPLFSASHGTVFISCSNCCKAGFLDVLDFREAVIKQGAPHGARFNAVGKPAFVYTDIHNKLAPSGTYGINIIAIDARGNYWVIAVFSPQIWARFEAQARLGYDD